MIRVNGDPMPWQEGLTVREVLKARKFTFPMIIVSIDGGVVARERYDTALIPDGAEVKVFHLMSGG